MDEDRRVCGQKKTLLGRERVCVREPGHGPPHEDASGATWVVGSEIAGTGYAELGDCLAEHHIGAGEEGAAAAAWLHQRTGWDGRVERVEEPDDEPSDGDESRADP